jgi:DNA-binding CsgD family transcriptional regulator
LGAKEKGVMDDHDAKPGSVELLRGDYEAVMRVIHELHACRNLEDFPLVVTMALSGLIPCNLAAYNEVNVAMGRMRSLAVPIHPQLHELIAIWEKHMAEHPILNYYRSTQDGQALTISDFLSESEFHALGLYRDFFSQVGAEDQLAVGFFLGESVVVGLAFNRAERSFTERDRRVLNLVRPHLVQAYAAAREFDELKAERRLLQEALGSVGHGVIRYHLSGAILGCSGPALEALEVESEADLEKVDWLRREREAFVKGGKRQWVVTDRADSQVRVCWHRSGERITGIFSETPVGQVARRFGLTKRESEVLKWVAEGKSNAEVGEILGLAHGTVKIHVQHVLAKLGVPSRSAAAAMASGWSAL